MAESIDWEFPSAVQPKPDEVSFDLERALAAVVGVRAECAADAFTAGVLGTEREGNGVVLREDGLVLTIGYLTVEAESVWLTTGTGVAVPAHSLAYDQPTGFGLVQALGRLGVPALERGSAGRLAVGDPVIVAGQGGRRRALNARVVSKREFAGYWEYLLEEAIFTAPAHPQWGGAAVIDRDGRLAGIGSLFVKEAEAEGRSLQGNMIVPIDLLDPILDDLLSLGRAKRVARPWLGIYATEVNGHVVIASLASGGPAEGAGLQQGDVVLEVAEAPVRGLADLFRKVWALGAAGVEVPLTVAREGGAVEVRVRSADRNDLLKKPRLH
ncbi:MAG: serine protease [Proteobacteria bacterium]|nr:serine protease [Pseudomonadota bacterium]